MQHGIIGKLKRWFPNANPELTFHILSLLFNLSFDHSLRSEMVQAGLLPELVKFLNEPRYATGSAHLALPFRCNAHILCAPHRLKTHM